MPGRDLLHPVVRTALERDGWTITADPLVLKIGRRNMFVDLGAERILSAERGAERIAVEVKSFLGESDLVELEAALGQYVSMNGCCGSNSRSGPCGLRCRRTRGVGSSARRSATCSSRTVRCG